jgi:hypothetical protein
MQAKAAAWAVVNAEQKDRDQELQRRGDELEDAEG